MNKIPNETRISERAGDYPSEPQMEVPYQFTPALPEILTHLNASLVVSTYQAGKVLVIGVHDQQLQISFLDFDQPMGIAAGREKIAIGTKSEIQFFQGNHRAAANIAPQGAFDGCFVAHTSRHTGRILGHDLAWGTEGLWIVNTLFSCLCTLDDKHSFVPRWKPTFISGLADQDRCHLNGLAMEHGRPRYVSALAETDTAAGWRADKAHSGCIIDMEDGQVLTRGLAMPHSPRIHNAELWVLDSGHGCLARVDRDSGQLTSVESGRLTVCYGNHRKLWAGAFRRLS